MLTKEILLLVQSVDSFACTKGKMISSSREKGFQAKQEGDANDGKFSKARSGSRQWKYFRNPRIVQVSRSFGGKDRHSKVCTIRGLRDTRIRLSVPTAIQLYDLQEKLGLGQPSKVIDWLLDATKHDIDKLPPLGIPLGFGQLHQQMLVSHASNSSPSSFAPFLDENSKILRDGGTHSLQYSKEGIKINNIVDGEDQTTMTQSKYWDVDVALRAKRKESERETISEESKWIKLNEQENQDGICGYGGHVSAQHFFPMPGLLNNAIPYNNYHWEPSNLSLSQFGSHGFLSQAENPFNNNAVSLPGSLSLPSGSQLFFCPTATTPSLFSPCPPCVTAPVESDPRQINHFQPMSSSQNILPNYLRSSLPMKSFSLNVNPKLIPLQSNSESHPDDDNTGS